MQNQQSGSPYNVFARIFVGLIVAVFIHHGITGKTLRENFWANQAFIASANAQFSDPNQMQIVGEIEEPNQIALNTARIIELGRSDHIALFEWALRKHSGNIRDYTTTFYKQERIRGRLKPVETINVKFREEPFSLLMLWQANAGLADKLLYVEGQNDGKMLVHPTGFFSWISSVSRDPHHPDVLKNSLRTCDQFGFANSIESMLGVYRQAQANGHLEVSYIGPTTIDDRPCEVIERNLPAEQGYPYAKMVVAIDVEYVLPTSVTCYDWQGRLISQYIYTNLQFNTGLSDAEFVPSANGL